MPTQMARGSERERGWGGGGGGGRRRERERGGGRGRGEERKRAREQASKRVARIQLLSMHHSHNIMHQNAGVESGITCYT